MLHGIFCFLLGGGLLYSLLTGQGERVMNAVLSAAGEAVTSALSLAGGLAFFSGLMNILWKAGVPALLSRRLKPLLHFLMGSDLDVEERGYVTMNLAINMLGLGNAATPIGMKAAQMMTENGRATDALCLFLVINSSSVQLLPTTVLSLRAASGSMNPGSVILPTLIATGLSTVVGILTCKAAERFHE